MSAPALPCIPDRAQTTTTCKFTYWTDIPTTQAEYDAAITMSTTRYLPILCTFVDYDEYVEPHKVSVINDITYTFAVAQAIQIDQRQDANLEIIDITVPDGKKMYVQISGGGTATVTRLPKFLKYVFDDKTKTVTWDRDDNSSRLVGKSYIFAHPNTAITKTTIYSIGGISTTTGGGGSYTVQKGCDIPFDLMYSANTYKDRIFSDSCFWTRIENVYDGKNYVNILLSLDASIFKDTPGRFHYEIFYVVDNVLADGTRVFILNESAAMTQESAKNAWTLYDRNYLSDLRNDPLASNRLRVNTQFVAIPTKIANGQATGAVQAGEPICAVGVGYVYPGASPTESINKMTIVDYNYGVNSFVGLNGIAHLVDRDDTLICHLATINTTPIYNSSNSTPYFKFGSNDAMSDPKKRNYNEFENFIYPAEYVTTDSNGERWFRIPITYYGNYVGDINQLTSGVVANGWNYLNYVDTTTYENGGYAYIKENDTAKSGMVICELTIPDQQEDLYFGQLLRFTKDMLNPPSTFPLFVRRFPQVDSTSGTTYTTPVWYFNTGVTSTDASQKAPMHNVCQYGFTYNGANWYFLQAFNPINVEVETEPLSTYSTLKTRYYSSIWWFSDVENNHIDIVRMRLGGSIDDYDYIRKHVT